MVFVHIVLSFVVTFAVFVFVLLKATAIKEKKLNTTSLTSQDEQRVRILAVLLAILSFGGYWAIYNYGKNVEKRNFYASLKADSLEYENNEGPRLDFKSFQDSVEKNKTVQPTNAFLKFKFGMTKSQFNLEYKKLQKNMKQYGKGIYTYEVQLTKNGTIYDMAISPDYYNGLLYKLSLTAYADFDATRVLERYFEEKYKSKPYRFMPTGDYTERIWIDGRKFIAVSTVEDDYPGVTNQLQYGRIDYYDSKLFIEKTIEDGKKVIRDSLNTEREEEKRVKETGSVL